MDYRNGEISHWMHADAAASPPPRAAPAPLPTAAQDLVIVGGGLTGLWAAYYASRRHPEWAITVLEAERVGYGASGRNGGWLSGLIPGNRAVYARAVDRAGGNGLAAVRAFQGELFATIDEVLEVLAAEGIDAHQVRGGNLEVAQTAAGMERLRARRAADIEYGYGEDQAVLQSPDEVTARIEVAHAHGGVLYPQTAAVDPALLCQGLAGALRARGARICEGARAGAVQAAAGTGPATVVTERGAVSGATVLVCLEAYSGSLRSGLPALGPRQVIPVNSSMIVTEPLSDADWQRIGWDGRACLGDAAHTFVYAQRTADGRIAIGGRGSPYRFNSGTPGAGEVDRCTVAQLARQLAGLFPQVFPDGRVPVAHAWRGVIGVTRDWCAGVFFDDRARVGTVRGYAGHGVTATNLAARTLLDRAEGLDTPLTRLPWNDHDSGAWEPEPIRWAGVHGMYRLFGVADAWEERRGAQRTSLLARLGGRLAGLAE
ncbi:FAD-dependent oxidoreductase [Brevibacterium sp. 5221]|uniref:FAD-dependent oxidoreductase n=1 Tax=Brevibacterium rongguiense TaxID=2695267 RepID=A0A6N9H9D3_9MICO|nr:FAD-binding oxidoreductase [Brevibacterium rongguiense]MYM20441.1 FAD-dependent oxidoreductase [Brevibacterium rongguiense]